MDEYFENQFESQLPKLVVETEKIQLEAANAYEATIHFKNMGGSILTGYAKAVDSFVTVTPAAFSGNDLSINCKINPKQFVEGDLILSKVNMTTDGGEACIPVEIKITEHILKTRQGQDIKTIKDFALYAFEDANNAKKMFAQEDFSYWLSKRSESAYTVYAHLLPDSNKMRAMDNFLILTGYKESAHIKAVDKDIEILLNPNIEKLYTGTIKIERVGWGYVEGDIVLNENANWLRIMKENFSAIDFNNKGIFQLTFTIDHRLIKSGYAYTTLFFHSTGEPVLVNISVKKASPVEIFLSKESFLTEDNGELIIENNTGKDIIAEIVTKDSSVKFNSKKYFVKERSEIPFIVKLNTFQSFSQFGLKRIPIYETQIYVKINNMFYTLKVKAGNLI